MKPATREIIEGPEAVSVFVMIESGADRSEIRNACQQRQRTARLASLNEALYLTIASAIQACEVDDCFLES